MSNSLLTSSIVTAETLSILTNNLFMGKNVHRDVDKIIKAEKPGTTVTIRLPERAVIRTGKTLNVANVAPPSATVTLDSQIGCDFSFDSDELAHSVDRFAERHLQPRAVQIANEIERLGFLEYVNVYNWVGTAGTTPVSYATSVQLLSVVAMENSWPTDGKWCLGLGPAAYGGISGGLTGLHFENPLIAGALEGGKLPHLGEFMTKGTANVATHTVGVYSGTPLTEGAGAEDDTVTDTDAWGSGVSALTKGDVFTIEGVYGVNPLTRASTGRLQHFVVTSAISDTSGDMDIPHSPTIVSTGAYQLVNSIPADEIGITVITGTTGAQNPQNLAWHPEAFALTMATLPSFPEVWGDTITVDGYSMRVIQQYDINNDTRPCRMDVLLGWDTIRRELAARLSG